MSDVTLAVLLFAGLVLLIGGGMFLGGRAWTRRVRRRNSLAIRTAAQRLGLTADPQEFRASGEVQGSFVGIDSFRVHDQRGAYFFTRYRAVVGLPPTLTLGLPQPHGMDELLGKSHLVIGDPVFDAEFRIEGDAASIMAALDFNTRQALREAASRGISVVNGTLEMVRPKVVTDPDILVSDMTELLAVAQRLRVFIARRENESVAQGLYTAFSGDPMPAVRMNACALLLAYFRESEPARQASSEVLADAGLRSLRPDLGVLASGTIGDAGIPVLIGIVSAADVPTPVRAQAVAALGRLPSQAAGDALAAVQGQTSGETLAAVLRTRAARGQAPERETLHSLLLDSSDSVRCAAASCIGALPPSEASEEALLNRLADAGGGLTVELVAALGRMGSRRAVEVLQPLTGGVLTHAEIKRQATAALDAIQARLGSPDAGRLAIAADGAAGAITLAPEGGGLAVQQLDSPAQSDPRDRHGS